MTNVEQSSRTNYNEKQIFHRFTMKNVEKTSKGNVVHIQYVEAFEISLDRTVDFQHKSRKQDMLFFLTHIASVFIVLKTTMCKHEKHIVLSRW